jgi:hypothetical protein
MPCHCSLKKGAPIIVIGKPTFNASMKGHRAAPPKKLIQFLARFFTIITVDEHGTSKNCSQCMKPLRQVGKSTRIWECTGGCKRKDENGPLIVNKDRSAALGMLLIFATLLATGSRPDVYIPMDVTAQDAA